MIILYAIFHSKPSSNWRGLYIQYFASKTKRHRTCSQHGLRIVPRSSKLLCIPTPRVIRDNKERANRKNNSAVEDTVSAQRHYLLDADGQVCE